MWVKVTGILSDNIAWDGMTAGSVAFSGANAHNGLGGTDTTALAIYTDGTLGGRFVTGGDWTSEDGKLPGFDAAVDIPTHLIPPLAPTLATPTPGNTQVTLAWTAPTSNGGTAITDYEYAYGTTSGAGTWTSTGSTGTTCTVTGLTNGTTYYFRVRAVNAAGYGATSNELTATPRTVPDAPTTVSATAGDTEAEVSFTASVNNGGAAITGYTVTSSPDGLTATGTVSPITVTGLTNGTSYTFTVTATNAAGDGTSSGASNPAVTPVAPITAVAITVVAPMTDSVPVTAAAGGTGYTSAVTWTPSPAGTFLVNTVYTATVTLTADAAHTFTTGCTATVNGQLATVTSNTGTVTLTYQFPQTVPLYALTVTAASNGTISGPHGFSHAAGANIALMAIPHSGYRFDGWTATGLTLTPVEVTANPLTFSMPAGAVMLAARFVILSIGGYDNVNTPSGCPPVQSGGTWSLPCGGTLTDPDDGTDYDLPSGSTVTDGGTIVVGRGGGEATTDGGSTVDLSGGTQIIPNGDGSGHTVVRPGENGLTVTFPDGSAVHVPDNGSYVVIHPSYPGGLRIIGAPAAPNPIMRQVTLRLPAGIVSQPASGMHRIASGRDFVFTLTLPSGQVPTVKTDRLIQGDPEVLTALPNADGSYTFTIRQVRQTLEITVTSGVGNAGVSASTTVWANGGTLYIAASTSGEAYIYNVSGQLVKTLHATSLHGETATTQLPRGVYIVVVGGKTYKVII
ncbi:MAG: fibronectin type III domain-containing protein [Tannerella sp.]|jgi:hypothetical protein|nr:fibronectin type III domain-containing protein [Tannerella sp.]